MINTTKWRKCKWNRWNVTMVGILSKFGKFSLVITDVKTEYLQFKNHIQITMTANYMEHKTKRSLCTHKGKWMNI